MLIVRPATRRDIDAFCWATGSDRAGNPSVRAWAGETEGRIVAIGGIGLARGRWFGFIDVTEEGRRYRVTLARAMKAFLQEARRDGIRYIYAEAAPEEKGAARRLKKLGFIVDPRSQMFYRWSAERSAEA